MLNDTISRLRSNIDARIVTSFIVGSVILGGVTFVAMKSGIKPLAKVAKAVK